MNYDPENEVIRLCAEGMAMEGKADPQKARELFSRAWEIASDNLEKFTAAHYLARQQGSTREKLQWDKKALHFALRAEGEDIKGALPSLYLNIGKGYEDLGDPARAREYYEKALSFTEYLHNDGYGKLLTSGIKAGLDRVKPGK